MAGAQTAMVGRIPPDKLRVPAVRAGWVERPELVARLVAAAEVRVVVLAAPAGYGKSTALALWAADGAERRTFAWVSLDRLDNDPVRLWTAILLAFARAVPGLDVADLLSRLRVQDPDIAGEVVPALLARLATTPIVLVLDDLHVVTATACHGQLQALVAALGPGCQLVLSSRSVPALALARLRTAGEVLDLGLEDLRFTGPQASGLLAGVADIDLAQEQLSTLLERTEGWPAGLYLAALSLRRRGDPAAFLREFTGRSRYVEDYLTEEVLGNVPMVSRAFLMRTAILERVSAPLAAAVTGIAVAEADALVADLVGANLFVIALDDQGEWFRYHHLLGQSLLARLATAEPELVPELHRRAAGWLAQRGQVAEAMAHAVAASDPRGAIELIAGHWMPFVASGQVATVRGALDAVGTEAIRQDALASVCAAWVAAMSGDLPGSGRWLDIAEDLGLEGSLPDGTRSLKSAAALIRAGFILDDLDERVAEARRAAEVEDDPASLWYTLARFFLGLNQYLAGDHTAAFNALEQAVSNPVTTPLFRVCALAVQSLVSAVLGRDEHAAAVAAVAREQVEAHHLTASAQATLVYTAHGAALTRAGRLAEARAELDHATSVRARMPGLSIWPTVINLVALAQLDHAAGEFAAARTACDRADDLLSRKGHRGHLAEQIAQVRRLLATRPRTVPDPLTGREQAVLRMLCGQLSLAAIAAHLHVSVNTVKTHTQAVYRKLGASSRADAIRVAREHGLVP